MVSSLLQCCCIHQWLLFIVFGNHAGQTKDVLDKLSTFGIPWQSLPIAHDGVPKTKAHRNWLKLRRTQEQQEQQRASRRRSCLDIVVVPSGVDILLGRGKPIQGEVKMPCCWTVVNVLFLLG